VRDDIVHYQLKYPLILSPTQLGERERKQIFPAKAGFLGGGNVMVNSSEE
jgi:hypothetical protein